MRNSSTSWILSFIQIDTALTEEKEDLWEEVTEFFNNDLGKAVGTLVLFEKYLGNCKNLVKVLDSESSTKRLSKAIGLTKEDLEPFLDLLANNGFINKNLYESYNILFSEELIKEHEQAFKDREAKSNTALYDAIQKQSGFEELSSIALTVAKGAFLHKIYTLNGKVEALFIDLRESKATQADGKQEQTQKQETTAKSRFTLKTNKDGTKDYLG